MAVSIHTSLTARLPVILRPVAEPMTCSHVRPSGASQSSPASLKVTPRTSVAASARAGRVFRIRSSAQSGEQETAESAVAAAGERPMPNFTWTPSPASQSFRNESRASSTGLVPFNSGAAGRFLSLQSISKEEALGVVISAAMGTGWKTMTGLEGPSAPVDPVDSVDSLGMPIISPVSPRRTARVDFTCNKCGSRTRRAINPHAYREGTVFVQCQGCQVFHKLVDHLNLFHEFRGPVFHASDAGQHGFAEHHSVDILGVDAGRDGDGDADSSPRFDFPRF